ncbi:rho-related GTP-binding protein RhoE-like [Lampetra fluviatilis]
MLPSAARDSSSPRRGATATPPAVAGGAPHDAPPARCKVVVVGDSRSGKTALLHAFAKDSYPEQYVPTVFENYTASFELEGHRVELIMWDTSGLPHYDNVRPLSYPDANAILVCFDIARPETLDSVLKKWQGEIQEYCPNTKVFLVGCKSDLRTDLSILSEFSEQQQNPISYEQGASVARQIGAARYLECSARTLESSVREVFRAAAMALSTPGSAAGGRLSGGLKRSRSKRLLQRISRLGGRPELNSDPAAADKAKSCTIM